MSSNASFGFGAGALFATPSGVNQTPIQFGTLQDVSVDFTSSARHPSRYLQECRGIFGRPRWQEFDC